MQQDDNNDKEVKSDRVTEVVALLFVAIVMVFLYIKILFY